MKIIDYNYAQIADTVITASSSNVNFPANNIKNEFRGKEWRSNGHFEITNANNIFSGTIKAIANPAVTFFSTHAAGTPTTFPLLLNGIYTAKQLVDAINACITELSSTYPTVSKLQAVLTEKGTKFKIECTDPAYVFNMYGNTSHVGFAMGLPVTTNPALINTRYESITSTLPTIHTCEWVMFDTKTTEPIDTVAILWKKGGYQLSSDAKIYVEANATSNFSSPAYSKLISFDERNEIAQDHFASKNYRYWRVKIIDPHNVYFYVNIGTVVLGQSNASLTCTSNGFSFGLKDGSKVYETDFGQKYTDLYPKLKVLNINFDVMEMDETQSIIELFERVGLSQIVYISLDPTEQVLTNGQFWIYGKLAENLSLRHQVLSLFNSGLKIEESN